jgi:hypothetical protein
MESLSTALDGASGIKLMLRTFTVSLNEFVRGWAVRMWRRGPATTRP